MGHAAGDAEEEALVAMKWGALSLHKGVQVAHSPKCPAYADSTGHGEATTRSRWRSSLA
jgi:hypothetical protein